MMAPKYTKTMHIPQPTPTLSQLPFAKANKDSKNPGVLTPNGSRLPPPYPHQVDDCLFADIPHYITLTSAASIIALEDTLGPKHPCQPDTLSQEKLDLAYTEIRQMLGSRPA